MTAVLIFCYLNRINGEKMNKIQALVIAAAVSFAAQASAGGYQLNDYSITGLGRSFAGQGVVGDDYSAPAFNPAGMSLMPSGFQTGATLVQLRANVKNTDPSPSTGNPGTIRLYIPLPHFFIQHKINAKWDIGLGVYTPYGLSTRYKHDWFGKTHAVKSQLELLDIAPAVSYKITPQWTVGLTLIARYIHGEMTNIMDDTAGGVNKFDLDGWTKTAVFGVLYEPTPQTRIGFSYRPGSKQKVKGDHTIRDFPPYGGTFNGSADPDLPNTFLLSAYHQLDEKWGLSGSARWTRWSAFDDFVMTSDAPLFQGMAVPGEYHAPYQWKNSWTITVGADYKLNENWTLRAGTGYDESPSHDKRNRTARIPDNDRIWASCGFSYTQGRLSWDVGYAHMFMKTAVVEHTDTNSTPKTLRAKYDSQSNMLGVGLRYRF